MTAEEPKLSDFPDHIITRQFEKEDGSWTARSDIGINEYVSDPSIYSYGATRLEAAKNCADRIRSYIERREKKRDSGDPFAGYDLYYRLMPHWRKKVRLEELGINSSDVIRAAIDRKADWNSLDLEGRSIHGGPGWLEWVDGVKQFRFDLECHLANVAAMIEEGELSLEDGPSKVLELMRDEFKEVTRSYRYVRASEKTWETVESIAAERLRDLSATVKNGM